MFALSILLSAGTLAATGAAYGDDNGKNGKAEMAAAAKVTIEQAVKTASEKVSGKVIEADLEMEHKRLVWEIEVVTADKQVMEVHIDAETGAVIDVEEEKAKPKKTRKHEQKREHKE
jgi:uncharacterized membrane protein YkoI